MNWRDEVTQCLHKKNDGTRCSLDTQPGEYACTHHTIGLDDYINDPMAVIAKFRLYFPKNHHPACDRKGQNDCDCPDRTFGELAGLAYQRAARTSLGRTRLHRQMVKEEMRYRTRVIRDYYNSIDESHLWLGMPNPKWRQIRYFVWDDREERFIVKKHDRSIRNKTQLLKLLRREAPHHVYYTTSQFRNPAEVGPDPWSKSGRDKYIKKNAKRLALKEGRRDKERIKQLMTPVSDWSDYGNAFIQQEMYFDVDYEMETFQESAKETLRLAEFYDTLNFNGCEKDIHFVFSGGKGFHMVDYGFSVGKAYGDNYSFRIGEIIASEKEKSGKFKGAAYAAMMLSRQMKKRLIKRIRKEGILLDYEVTVDPRRIIRLPGTIHGKRGRVCRIISRDELHDFDPGPTLW
tara:strand:- start:232 stop:1440 length:1209 start_codon:yes stop_codon:yes gene_type:complete